MKTMSLFILAVAAFMLPVVARADALDDAHRAFAGGQYQAAAQGYQAVLAQNGYSAPVLFDLGNSYYREGDFAQAILAYERAQLLAPNDADLAANLAQARKLAGIPAPDPRWSDPITRLCSTSGWAWVGCGAWTVLCLGLLARRIWPLRRTLFFLSGAASALVLIAAIGAEVLLSGQLRQAVVVDKHASVLISPFPAAQAVFSPTPGDVVSVQKKYHDFRFVTDSSGRSGWIAKTQITPIVPE